VAVVLDDDEQPDAALTAKAVSTAAGRILDTGNPQIGAVWTCQTIGLDQRPAWSLDRMQSLRDFR
jgi:hypothetical protein